jgi:putative internalin
MLSYLKEKYHLDKVSANYLKSEKSYIRLYRNKVVEVIFSKEDIDTLDDLLPFADTLKKIAFRNCNLSDLSSLKFFKQLTRLGFRNCHFSNTGIFENFPNFPNLKGLGIDGREITHFNIFSNSIKSLSISETSIKTLIDINIPNLKSLSMTCNPIKAIDALFPKLRELYITAGNFDLYSLKYTPNLRDLYAYDCIKNQSFDGAAVCTKLKLLQLYGEPFTNFLPFVKLNSLEYLDLQESEIESLEGLEQMHNLKVLELFGNPIEKIDSIKPIRHLKKFGIEKYKMSPSIRGHMTRNGIIYCWI